MSFAAPPEGSTLALIVDMVCNLTRSTFSRSVVMDLATHTADIKITFERPDGERAIGAGPTTADALFVAIERCVRLDWLSRDVANGFLSYLPAAASAIPSTPAPSPDV